MPWVISSAFRARRIRGSRYRSEVQRYDAGAPVRGFLIVLERPHATADRYSTACVGCCPTRVRMPDGQDQTDMRGVARRRRGGGRRDSGALLCLALAEHQAGDHARRAARCKELLIGCPTGRAKLRLAELPTTPWSCGGAGLRSRVGNQSAREEALISLAVLRLDCAMRRCVTLLLRCCGIAPGNAEHGTRWHALRLSAM